MAYDPEADAARITLADDQVIKSEEAAPGVVLDIEMLRASETLANFPTVVFSALE